MKKQKLLSWILALVLVLGVIHPPLSGYAEPNEPAAKSIVTIDEDEKDFYANGNRIEIREATDTEQAETGKTLKITVLDASASSNTVLETHFISEDYTIYGGGASGYYESASIQMYSGKVNTIVAGGKADSVGNATTQKLSSITVYGGTVDTIKFAENGYVRHANIVINDQLDTESTVSVSNIIVGTAYGNTGNFSWGTIEGVNHPSSIKISQGYCCSMPLKEAAAETNGWKYLTINGSKFTGLDAFKEISNCVVNGVEMGLIDISQCAVGTITQQTYTGKAITPPITVTYGGKTLVKGTDYTVAYSNNINAGTATVTIKGIGKYTGTVTKYFTIQKPAPAKINISQCAVSTIARQTYTGKAITPKITVTYGGKTLVKGTDYTVTYSNNINAGTATVTIKGIGKYTGTVTKYFTIQKVLPARGSVIKDTKNIGKYQVIEADWDELEVKYVGPVNKNKTSVSIPATVALQGGMTAEVVSIGSKAFKNNKNIKTVTIGRNIESIGSEAFAGATKLTTVKIGSDVEKIGTKAFYKCKKLKSLSIGREVDVIGSSAFAKCTALKSVTIPADVEKIGTKAFYGDKKLKKITVKTRDLRSSRVGSKAFKGVYSKAKVNVPNSKVKAYKKFFYKKGLSKRARIS